ncbi:murein transglycosylase A [Thiolinea disciformis]|uniref:murein transglycosylase A n=1 Tax=Thiolinea disciformis TaxID=125614 RepID=UPI000372C36C|nr:murein transglycosylase A [Thiolinea disciformis]
MVKRGLWWILVASLCLAACNKEKPAKPSNTAQTPQPPQLSEALSWSKVPGWQQDVVQEAWPALSSNCRALALKQPIWQVICTDAATLPNPPDNASARAFFEKHFTVHQLSLLEGGQQGLMTGYYEPLLMGSFTPDERFKYPLYKTPSDMLTIDLGNVIPELKDKRIRGRLVEGNKVVPYYARADIEAPTKPLAGQELLWVDSREDAFFLEIQGSGRVQLPDGKVIGVNYANQNGYPYVAIGKPMQTWGMLEAGKVNMFTIKQWLREHPEQVDQVYHANPSYVFFSLRDQVEAGPLGSLGVPLTAERSVAVDKKMIELGSVLWVDTTYPDGTQAPLQKLVFAQDTGGAIKGSLRADFFFGTGKVAEERAGLMARKAEFYMLKPKDF